MILYGNAKKESLELYMPDLNSFSVKDFFNRIIPDTH